MSKEYLIQKIIADIFCLTLSNIYIFSVRQIIRWN